MVSAFLACIALSNVKIESITIEPTDDVWVYQFAEEQVSDQYLRVWGSDAGAVGTSFEGHLPFSYSCLKFSFDKVNPEKKLVGAKLILTHTPEAGWSSSDSSSNPLEIRTLVGDWNEKSWTYDDAKKVHPSADAATILGTGSAKPASDDKPFAFEVVFDVDNGAFPVAYKAALDQGSKVFSVALTSKLMPSQAGENTVYKFFSKANEPELRPKLELMFAD